MMNINSKNKNFKAQFWSFDVIFAMVIFILALTILGFTWYNVNNQLALGYSGSTAIAQLQAHSLAQNLLSMGSPANWQSMVNTTNALTWSNISVGLGMSASGTNISTKKLYTFMSMANQNYQATKFELGISYEYYISIYGGMININIGRNPANYHSLTNYVERRSAFVAGVPVIMQVVLWTNTTLAIS